MPRLQSYTSTTRLFIMEISSKYLLIILALDFDLLGQRFSNWKPWQNIRRAMVGNHNNSIGFHNYMRGAWERIEEGHEDVRQTQGGEGWIKKKA